MLVTRFRGDRFSRQSDRFRPISDTFISFSFKRRVQLSSCYIHLGFEPAISFLGTHVYAERDLMYRDAFNTK